MVLNAAYYAWSFQISVGEMPVGAGRIEIMPRALEANASTPGHGSLTSVFTAFQTRAATS